MIRSKLIGEVGQVRQGGATVVVTAFNTVCGFPRTAHHIQSPHRYGLLVQAAGAGVQ